MVPQEFIRRASMAALVIVATVVMACGEKKSVPPALEQSGPDVAARSQAPAKTGAGVTKRQERQRTQA